jgi:hypothetical protein
MARPDSNRSGRPRSGMPDLRCPGTALHRPWTARLVTANGYGACDRPSRGGVPAQARERGRAGSRPANLRRHGAGSSRIAWRAGPAMSRRQPDDARPLAAIEVRLPRIRHPADRLVALSALLRSLEVDPCAAPNLLLGRRGDRPDSFSLQSGGAGREAMPRPPARGRRSSADAVPMGRDPSCVLRRRSDRSRNVREPK